MKVSIFALVAVAALLPAHALADDLPGVEPAKPIVQPLPEPQDGASSKEDDRIKVGDWDVKISGSIIVDVGVGEIKPPRR